MTLNLSVIWLLLLALELSNESLAESSVASSIREQKKIRLTTCWVASEAFGLVRILKTQLFK